MIRKTLNEPTMKQAKVKWATLAGVVASAAFATGAHAQTSDALLNALIKKGVLTEQEAKDIQTEVSKEQPSFPELKLSPSDKTFEIYGDARVRYEMREGQNALSDTYSRDRFRYRLRLGIRGEYKDNWYYGLRLETSAKARSTNVTFGDDAGGPSAKGSDVVHIGQVYLGWKAQDWMTLEVGRMANPLYTTSMVWDPDINPEGASERFTYNVNDRLSVFATLGQFLYDDANPENSVGATPHKNDSFLLAWQTGAKVKINKDMSATIAPTIYNYTGTGDSFSGMFSAANQGAINNLLIVEVPLEFNFMAGPYPMSAFADFAVNTDAGDRASRSGLSGAGNEDKAYQIGLSIGKTKKKGSWSAKAYWQHEELFALDPNLIDSDIFDSHLNMEGFVLSFSYALTDTVAATLTYARADRANKNLPTYASDSDIAVGNSLNDYQLFQADLSWKF